MKALINSCRQSCKLHGSAVCCCKSSSTSLYFVCFFIFFIHILLCSFVHTRSVACTMYMTLFHLSVPSLPLSLSLVQLASPQFAACLFNSIHRFVVNCLLLLLCRFRRFFCCARFIKLTMKCVFAAKRIMRLKNETHKTRRLHKIDTVNNKTIHIFQDKHQQMSASASA